MASHFENTSKKPRLRLRCDPKERFPEKVYDVANDGYLIEWNGAGTAVVVNEPEFEENIMDCYPGFVQIPTMLNLRRLFREYGFDWRIIEMDGPTFEFSHPCFVYGQRDLLSDILTRRKSMGKPKQSDFHKRVHELSQMETDGDGDGTPKPLTRRRVKRMENSEKNKDFDSDQSYLIDDDFCCDSRDSVASSQKPETNKDKNLDLLKLMIQNEFSFDEFCLWASKNQDYFQAMQPPMENTTVGIQGRYASESDHRLVIPCGKCACCEAHQRKFFVYSNGDFQSQEIGELGEVDFDILDSSVETDTADEASFVLNESDNGLISP